MAKGKPIDTCHLCRAKVTQEFFCFGCRVHICFKCDVTLCMGRHTPVQHVLPVYGGEFHGEALE